MIESGVALSRKRGATKAQIVIDFAGASVDFVWATNESPPRFRAMFFRKKTSGGRAYLQIVENRREDGAVRQQVIATLGRLEDLRQSATVAVWRALRRQGHRRGRRGRRR